MRDNFNISMEGDFLVERKRVVVKIGSSSLTNSKGELDHEKFHDHVAAIATMKQAGHEVILVSSGAVAAGFKSLATLLDQLPLKGNKLLPRSAKVY